MTQLPTFRDLKTRLIDEFSCSYKQSRYQITDSDGNVFCAWFFTRIISDERTVQCVVDITEEDEIVLPSQLRNICTLLHIDLGEFGLSLD